MLRRVLASFAMMTVAFALVARANDTATTKKEDPSSIQEEVKAKQMALEARFHKLTVQLRTVAERLARSPKKEDREKAQHIQDALKLASEAQIGHKFQTLIELLGKKPNINEIEEAIDQNKELLDSLDAMIALLMSDSKDEERKKEIERLQNILKELNKVIRDQKIVRAKTERGHLEPKEIQEAQKHVTGDTRNIAGAVGGDPKAGKNDKGNEAKGTGKSDKDGKGDKGGEAKSDKDGKGDKGGEAKSDKDGKGDKGGEAKSDKGGEGSAKSGKDSKGDKGGEGAAKDAKDSKGDKGGEGAAKDAKDSKDGKGGEGASKPSKPPEGTAKDGKDGKDSKGGEGAAKDAKDSKDGKGSEGASKPSDSKGKPGEGKPSDGKPSDGKSGDSKPSDSKSDSKGDSKGQPSQGGDSKGSGKGDDKPQPPAPPSPPSKPKGTPLPGKKQIEEAIQKQEEAEKILPKKDASDPQDQAIQKLEEARAELEKLLKQKREEELDALLAQLEARCKYMLMLQIEVYEGTVSTFKSIESNTDKKPGKLDHVKAQQLSEKEFEIVKEAKRAIGLLEADNTAVAFTEVFRQLKGDMELVQHRLGKTDVGMVPTQKTEEEIIDALKEMIAALQKARQDLKQPPPPPGPPGTPPPPGAKDLLDKIAELKLVRSRQVVVNKRTDTWNKVAPGEQSDPQDVQDELKKLSKDQSKLHKIITDMATKKNE